MRTTSDYPACPEEKVIGNPKQVATIYEITPNPARKSNKPKETETDGQIRMYNLRI